MSFDRRTKQPARGRILWFTLAALAIVVTALVLEFLQIMPTGWIWGLIFLFWSAPSLFTGVTFLVEPVHQSENKWLFWIIVTLWLSLALMLIGWDIASLFV